MIEGMISVRRFLPALSVLLVTATALAGCQLRLDTHASPFERLSTDDVARFRASTCDTEVAAAFTAPGAIPEGAQGPLGEVAAAATERVTAFGKPWEFPTKGAPAPPAPKTPPAPTDAAAALARLVTCGRLAMLDAAVVTDPHLATLLVAAAAARSHEAGVAAAALGQAVPDPEAVEASGPLVLDEETHRYRAPSADALKATPTPPTPDATPDADEARALGEALAELDYARFSLEQGAARLDGGVQSLAIALAGTATNEAEVLIENGAPDTRRLDYGRLDLSDPAARVREAAAAILGAQYHLAAASAREEVRTQATLGAIAAWGALRAWGAPADGLPGLDVTAPAVVLPTTPPVTEVPSAPDADNKGQ